MATKTEIDLIMEHPKVVEAKKEIAELEGASLDFMEIEDDADLTGAVGLFDKVGDLLKRTENTRDMLAKPKYDEYKRIRTVFGTLVEPLDELKKTLSGAIKAYREKAKIQAELKAAEAAKEQAAIAEVAAELGEDLPLDALAPVEDDMVTKSMTGSTGAKVSARDNWTYTCLDMSLVPQEYIVPTLNVAKVKQAIKDGVREIPGLKIFNDEILVRGRGR